MRGCLPDFPGMSVKIHTANYVIQAALRECPMGNISIYYSIHSRDVIHSSYRGYVWNFTILEYRYLRAKFISWLFIERMTYKYYCLELRQLQRKHWNTGHFALSQQKIPIHDSRTRARERDAEKEWFRPVSNLHSTIGIRCATISYLAETLALLTFGDNIDCLRRW